MVATANIRAAAAIVIDKRFIDFGIIILPDCAASWLRIHSQEDLPAALAVLVRSVGAD